MLKLSFSESRSNSKLVMCVLRPPYSNAMRDNALNILDLLFPKNLLSLGLLGG